MLATMLLPVLVTSQGVAPLSPVLAVDGFVVGYREQGRWRRAEPKTASWGTRPAMAFREIGLGPVGGATRARFIAEEVPEGVYLREPARASHGVLVGGVVPRVPRRVVTYGTISPTYTKLLRTFLDANGLKKAKARITRMASVDLDGDGTKEVLIEARSREGLDSLGLDKGFGPNDYSLVLLRTVRGRASVNNPIEFAHGRHGGSLVRRLRAIADVDGDGRMEIVTSYSAWEAFGGALWSFRAGKATLLVEHGSGV